MTMKTVTSIVLRTITFFKPSWLSTARIIARVMLMIIEMIARL